jgi:hypothetical protein
VETKSWQGGNKIMALNKGWKDFQGTKYTTFYKGGKIFKVESGHKNISCNIGERP